MKVITTSQDWWPADYGSYPGCSSDWPGTVRAPIASLTVAVVPPLASSAWHPSAVGPTTRTSTRPAGCSGRSSRIRQMISWADLMILAGNCALESSRFKTFGSPAPRGRLGTGRGHLLGAGNEVAGRQASLQGPVARATSCCHADGIDLRQPGRPNGKPDPLAAKDIRTTFGRMAMNDEETVA